jgi:hypothetical protein
VSIQSRLRKKKEKVIVENIVPKTELEQFLADDKETYEALRRTMFLDPRKTETTMREAAEKAKKAEKAEKPAVVLTQMYELAGGLAIYEGDAKKVAEYFGKCEKISPNRKYPILKNPEKAVAKASEYYQKYLKT